MHRHRFRTYRTDSQKRSEITMTRLKESPTMSTTYYYSTSRGETFGPLTGRQIKRAAASGLVLPDDIVWKAGGRARIPARRVIGLFPTLNATGVPGLPGVAGPQAVRSFPASSYTARFQRWRKVLFAVVFAMTACAWTWVLMLSRSPESQQIKFTDGKRIPDRPSIGPPATVAQSSVIVPPVERISARTVQSYGRHYLSEIRNHGVFLVVEQPVSDPVLSRRLDERGAGTTQARDIVARMLGNAGIRVFEDEKTWIEESRRLRRPILSLRISPAMVLLENDSGFYSIKAEVGQPARLHPGTMMAPIALLRSWHPSSGIATLDIFGDVFRSGLVNLLENIIADINGSPDPVDRAPDDLLRDLEKDEAQSIEPRSYLRAVAREGVIVRPVELIAGPDDRRKLADLGFEPERLRPGVQGALRNAGYTIRDSATPPTHGNTEPDVQHEVVPSLEIHFKRLGLTSYVVLSARLALVEPVRIAQSPMEALRAAIPLPGFSRVQTIITSEDGFQSAVAQAYPTLIAAAGEMLSDPVLGTESAVKQVNQSQSVEGWLDEDDFYPRRRFVATKVAGLIEGEVRCYAANGGLCLVEHVERGVPQGLRTCYYPSGRKFMEMSFRDGKSEGTERFWFENAILALTMEYRAGVPHGSMVTYFRNGRPQIEANLVNGRFQGTRRHFLHTGELLGFTYWQDGQQVGQRLVREASWSDLQFAKGSAFSARLKDHWHGTSPDVTETHRPAEPKPGMDPDAPRRKRPVRRSRIDPTREAMLNLFGR
jgi:hypothetical protein